ncbi:ABC transporter ATP-binding protein [Alkalihalobacillus pseudalcaliphilus]|uniref:ABC transporter ATP-binding protein n=1 Tax=Alkalihalobacillus pseudalcaliphilus TaxID=79884 RepID=UPI00064E087C|nr:ABC transporter ATP-binding protein [Alkalihalobacillus pseudalcaliphilus]KMK75201.1 ABC transporter ATP-binding protein [Alkalihalobacillus pseudalcaliphilus]
MNVIEIRGLSKKFGQFQALKDVNLEVREGEIFGFIGPNGAGKSTTIRVLLGLLKGSSGHATIFNQDVWKQAVPIHQRLAYVPGDVHLWPNLSGGEVIDMFLKIRGAKKDEQRKKEFIERFALDPTKKCRTYSKGNRQKVALVSAFSSDVDLFILDEPTSGLDPLMEQTFQECVLEAKEAGKTILLSSHILSEVEKLCDRIGIIRKGEIIETGTLEGLRHLTRNQMTIETKREVTNLEGLQGVHDVRKDNHAFSFQIDTEHLEDVMAYISSFGLTKLESKPPALEDLFMRHYEDDAQKMKREGRVRG